MNAYFACIRDDQLCVLEGMDLSRRCLYGFKWRPYTRVARVRACKEDDGACHMVPEKGKTLTCVNL